MFTSISTPFLRRQTNLTQGIATIRTQRSSASESLATEAILRAIATGRIVKARDRIIEALPLANVGVVTIDLLPQIWRPHKRATLTFEGWKLSPKPKCLGRTWNVVVKNEPSCISGIIHGRIEKVRGKWVFTKNRLELYFGPAHARTSNPLASLRSSLGKYLSATDRHLALSADAQLSKLNSTKLLYVADNLETHLLALQRIGDLGLCILWAYENRDDSFWVSLG